MTWCIEGSGQSLTNCSSWYPALFGGAESNRSQLFWIAACPGKASGPSVAGDRRGEEESSLPALLRLELAVSQQLWGEKVGGCGRVERARTLSVISRQ